MTWYKKASEITPPSRPEYPQEFKKPVPIPFKRNMPYVEEEGFGKKLTDEKSRMDILDSYSDFLKQNYPSKTIRLQDGDYYIIGITNNKEPIIEKNYRLYAIDNMKNLREIEKKDIYFTTSALVDHMQALHKLENK